MKPTAKNTELASLERDPVGPEAVGCLQAALGFPNSYEIGMSNLGFQWVYRLFNRVPDLVCERFFFDEGAPAVSFETGTPLSEFGLLAWSLSWEMDIVNIVKTLRAAGIPARRTERGEGEPLILIGGDIARMNPAALTTFADVFALGDGERLVPAVARLLQSGLTREARPLTDRTGLIATAVCDHPEITEILTGLADLEYHIALSSIKIDAIDDPILEVLARQGEKALAIAPEAGNERLRRHINKKVSDEMLREKVRMVFARGFTRLKLYYQVGLPTETDEDVRDIVRLVKDLREIALAEGRRTGQVPQLVPSVNAFIPKPHTPYEDESLANEGALKEKLSYLQREFESMGNVLLRGMSLTEAVWEAYLAKMDETVADILE